MNLKIKMFIVLILAFFMGIFMWYFSATSLDKSNLYKSNNNINSIIKNNNISEEYNIGKKETDNQNTETKLYEKTKSELINDVDKYEIKKGDTMSKVAVAQGFSDFDDLVFLNSLLGVEFEYLNKNPNSITLKLGYKMFVPKEGMTSIVINKLNQLKKNRYIMEVNNKINSSGSLDLLHLGDELYPVKVEGLGVEKFLRGFIETQKVEFDPYLPRIVDVKRQTTVSCANLIRTLLGYSVDREKLTDKEKIFFKAQGLDAWILPSALEEIGYVQKFNLMNNFSEYYVGTPDPVRKENKKKYEEDVIEVGKYLETKGIPGSILPLYFRYSDYTKVVANYNRKKTEKHYNTHQSVLAGVDFMSFEAKNVGVVANGKITKFDNGNTKEVTVFNFITNFIQQRGDYGQGALMNGTKKIVKANILTYQSLIKIKVNGTSVNLSEELKKDDDKMLKIKPDDKVEFYGPIMIDGLHMLSSPDISRRKNMNARTRFYFEFVSIGNFLPSELLEPQNNSLGIGIIKNDIISELKLKGIYSIKVGDTVEKALKEMILKYEKEKFDKLDKKDIAYNINYENLLNYYFSQQIKALKITGYMQSENDINPGAFNVNAPIPYYDTENVADIFGKYVSNMKEKLATGNTDIYKIKNFIQVTTFPLDSYKSLLGRIKDELSLHFNSNDNKYKNINLLLEFNELQQRKFLDVFLNKSEKTKKIVSKDFLNGEISEGVTMILSLREIDKIIYEISNETYSPNLNLSPSDEFAIDLVLNLVQSKNIIENVLYIESYIPVGSFGARRLIKQFLENNDFLQQTFYIFGTRFSTKISSYGDFQFRFSNLYKGLNEEGLNKDQLLQAFSYLESNDFYNYVIKLDDISKRRIRSDLDIVNDINSLLLDYDNVDEKFKEEYRRKIVSKLQKIIVLDDGTGKNIVGKIIGVSLLNDKINLHFQKLNGILQASGENISDVYNNKESMESYEKLAILINNLGELNVVYGLGENYLIRIFDSISSKLGKKYELPKLETTSTLGQFIYGKKTFLSHLLEYKKVLGIMKSDLENTYKHTDNEYLLLSSIITNLEKSIDEFHLVDNKKSSIEKVYDLFKNNNIKVLLSLLNKSNDKGMISILPLETEFSGSDFRDIFFRYINTRDIKRTSPGFFSKVISLIR